MNDDPARDPLAMQVRRRRPFYEQYLRPRIRQFCEAKGACLSLDARMLARRDDGMVIA